jgi:hypothetical protein
MGRGRIGVALPPAKKKRGRKGGREKESLSWTRVFL